RRRDTPHRGAAGGGAARHPDAPPRPGRVRRADSPARRGRGPARGARVGGGPARRGAVGSGEPHSAIFYGPPGTGKTTLARIIAARVEGAFEELSAVNVGGPRGR